MKHLVLSLITFFAFITCVIAQNVGIGVATPEAKLDVGGNIKITDGTQKAGYVLTSDNSGLATWESRKKTRVIRVTDPVTTCPAPYHTPIYNYSFTLTDSAAITVTGKSIRLALGRHDINLTIDGILVQAVLCVTTNTEWAEAYFTYGGMLQAGAHTIQVVPADNTGWGCGNVWGNMIVTIFD
ncbi:hypothetical protein LK994_11270 [Ferruginibacter lapsinanis]|uniref:hypothetical protein n=1 Tax=Ferruginibacter lapsinanis TaxID=563172 RepID=UPI001E51C060|nr:hypothetical protein [Ferruginibacter lapsinanis]UEG49210.1 hypothetical protein LK994_11270 [Ferruginibacter lapsinanis]